MDHEWSEVLPPKDLTDFLRSIKLEHLDTTLARLGFDDVEDFKSWDTDACAHFRSALEKDMVPVGHIGKVIRAISGLRPSCQASSLSPDVVTPVAPASSDAVPPAAVVRAAALSIGTATAAMHKDAHAAKVLSFINDQKKMNPDAPRLLYGRGHSAKIKPYEEVMNKAALELLYANPSLISWDGSRVKTQPLIDAAKIDANAAYEGWAKAKGSRAGGLAGDAGHRSSSSTAAFDSPGVGMLEMQSPSTSAKPRLTAAVRTTEMELLPRQILDMESSLKDMRNLKFLKQQRGTHDDLEAALELSRQIEQQQLKVNQSKRTLAELSKRALKADNDKFRGSQIEDAHSSGGLIPLLSNLNMPVSVPELERNKALAEQLNNHESFQRDNTWVKSGAAALRVSPLQGISIVDYVAAASQMQTHGVLFECGYLINACSVLDKEGEGACMPLRDLWRVAHGLSSKAASAQKMIDALMHAPLVAVRVGQGDSFDSSWVVMAKEANTNYKQLAAVMAAIERPSQKSRMISKERLQTLTRLASSASDRRLIELAALDTASLRTARELSGRKSETAIDRQHRERTMRTAVETMAAYEEVARIDSLSAISALIGDEITDSDLLAQMETLKSHDEVIQKEEEDTVLADVFLPIVAQYNTEEPDAELDVEADFVAVVNACTIPEADELAKRLMAAAKEAGFDMDLNMENLEDPTKQEELVRLFGDGWGEALRSCLCEPLLPGRDDNSSEASDDLDDCDGECYRQRLVDHTTALVLSVQRELGMVVLPTGETETAKDASLELMILAQLTPKQLVIKLLARNRRKRQRQAAHSEEVAAARRSLEGDRGRNIGTRSLDTVLSKWPDIGDKIEAICTDLQVGADASRRDGALTLNSAHTRRKGSVGFTRIRIELQTRHSIELSSRALRDLCVARDRRHRCAARYKGIVNLKMRRSVKRIGQANLDDHAQNATYRLLHYIRERTSFDNTLWLARDDHSMVRGNSSESTRQHATVTTTGEGASALKYDYMNPEISSSLYASTILVSGCADGGQERCLALTKAVKLAPSTPTQHMADFYSLQERARTDHELNSTFFTAVGKVKPKVQLEVDGGGDENPTGRETRFLQTELLMGGPMLIEEERRTQVGSITRHAGGSSQNKVERLNGEMTLAAAGFHAIASDDVVGQLRDEATGQYLDEQLKAMWAQHAEDYRFQLDRQCGLNGSALLAFPGATVMSCDAARLLLERRPKLLLLLDPTTSKKKMAEMEVSDLVLTKHVKKVLAMQEHTETLTHYSSCVRCCSNTGCSLCQAAPSIICWYENGPLLKPVPPALHDPDRPGHYLEPEAALQKYASMQYRLSQVERQPPSDLALAIYEREMGKSLEHFPEAKLTAATKEINDYRVTTDALRIYYTKLRYIRLRRLEGARKAAATRKQKKEARTGQPPIAVAAEVRVGQAQPTIVAAIAVADVAKAAPETVAVAETVVNAEEAAAAEKEAAGATQATKEARAETKAEAKTLAAKKLAEQAAVKGRSVVADCWFKTASCTFEGKHAGPCSTRISADGGRKRSAAKAFGD